MNNSATPQQKAAAQNVIAAAIQTRIMELRREANELDAALATMIAPEAAAADNLPPPPPPPGGARAVVDALTNGAKPNGEKAAPVPAGRS